MIEGVRSVGIHVADQDRAKQFWTDVIGFDLLQDTPMGEGDGAPRWIEVAPADRSIKLVLYTPEGQEQLVGGFSNVLFRCDDVRETHKQLSGDGVAFPDEPRKEFWGWWAVFQDPDGNSYGLSQRD